MDRKGEKRKIEAIRSILVRACVTSNGIERIKIVNVEIITE